MRITEVLPIASVVTVDRHRRDMGDLDGLAKSIREQGLLQPIGVTEGNVLVFGERRLRACRDILGWTEIPVRVINIASLIEGGHAENQICKDLDIAERVAIGRTIEAVLGERQREKRRTKEEWIARSRAEVATPERQSCAVCGRYRAIAESHHILPLSIQYDLGTVDALQDAIGLCPSHHKALHYLIADRLANRKTSFLDYDPAHGFALDELDSLDRLLRSFEDIYVKEAIKCR